MDDDVLRIFISHKMPADTSLAQEIGEKLGLFAADRIKIVHAGQFPSGDVWRSSIEREIDEAHWVILLHTDRDSDWNFCMFECGYFRARMKTGPFTRLIPMCQDVKYVSDALKEFNSIQVDVTSINKLLEEIYLEEPWKLSPKIGEKVLKETAEDIVALYEGSKRVEENFDVATNVTFELGLTDQNKGYLTTQRVPPETAVTGTADWQRLFGRLPNSSGWIWQTLVEKWPYSHIYEYLIASMINDAVEKRRPKGTLLRSLEDGELFRLTLRRYEVMKSKKYRFHFTAVRLDLPFDLPGQSREESIETILYHLINLTWYFRKRLVDQLYQQVLEVLSMPNPDPIRVANLYEEIGQEVKQIDAQAIIRQLDSPFALRRALGQDDPETGALIQRSKDYARLEKNIFDAMALGSKGLQQVAENLHAMALMNYEWFKKVTGSYADMAQKLPRPIGLDAIKL